MFQLSRTTIPFALVAGLLTACSAAEDQAANKYGADFCAKASTCFEFCVCATGEAERCFDSCDADDPRGSGGSGSGGGGGTGAATGGNPGTGGGASGGPAAGGAPAAGGSTGALSCAGACGTSEPIGGSCYCDPKCTQFNDCCPDFQALCGGGSGGSGATGGGGSGATGGGGSGATGGSGGGPTSCTGWPSGTPGAAMGSTLPQSLSWQGFINGSSSSGSTTIADYYDCDGSKGINAVLFITATTTCGSCKSEAKTLEAKMDQYAPLGIKVVTLMVYPATVAGAQSWKNAYGLKRVDVLADKMPPSMAYSNSIGTPLHTIVDPRTMKVVHTKMGGGSASYAKLVELAQQNKK